MTDDDRVREVAAHARAELAAHAELTAELAAIQKELERRVSLAKKRESPGSVCAPTSVGLHGLARSTPRT